MCQLYAFVHFVCGHTLAAYDENGWDLCGYVQVSRRWYSMAREHWAERQGRYDYEPGARNVAYMCLGCWNETADAQWVEFRAKWEPQMANSDWEVIEAWGQQYRKEVPPIDHVVAWCWHRHKTRESFNPFACFLGHYLKQVTPERKVGIEMGFSLDPKEVWHMPNDREPEPDYTSGTLFLSF